MEMTAGPVVNSEFVLNGQPNGDAAMQLAEVGYDSGIYRPYRDENGNRCVDLIVGNQYSPKLGRMIPKRAKTTLNEAKFMGYDAPTLHLTNATILRKDQWIILDQKVLKVARQRLRAWSDLAAANTHTVPGMAMQMLEHETMNDPGEAKVDMEIMSEGRTDRPLFQLEGMPLPITHSEFTYSSRELAISARNGTSLSTLSAEASGRRVAETIEKTTLGVIDGITFGTAANYSNAPAVRGYTNYTDRNTVVLTAPTGANSPTTVSEVLGMRSTLYADGFFGPFTIYNGTDWDQFLDDDHFKFVTSGGAAPNTTLRRRLLEIEDIRAVRRADYLTPALTGGTFDFVMVSLSNAEVARAVIGMPIKVVQWPSQGGARLNFRVMAIMASQIRSDYNGNCGINHGQVT